MVCGVVLFCAGCGGGPDATTQPSGDVANADRAANRSSDTPDEFVDAATLPGRTHWVQSGDTLYSLARRYYGDENQWRKIYSANQRRLQDANQLPVGTKLIIPP